MNLKDKRVLVGLGSAVALVLVLTSLAYAGVIPGGPALNCLFVPGSSRTFTIVADLGGFNDSKTQASDYGLGVWPVMNVSRCDHVTINLVNKDSQTHGLMVGALAMDPLLVPSGQTLSLSFLAYKTGHFLVYCAVMTCTVHNYMSNGQLNVS